MTMRFVVIFVDRLIMSGLLRTIVSANESVLAPDVCIDDGPLDGGVILLRDAVAV